MTRPAIDPGVDLIVWMIAIREAPIDYRGAGGVERLYRDIEDWRAAQENVDDMIDVGTHKVHPRRHGLNFAHGAAEHFMGYYGTPETRPIWVRRYDWGNWLERLSDSPEQALERVFNWLDLFVEIHGLTAPKPYPIKRDERPFLNLLDELRKMRKDPTLRPGDGSLRAAHVHMHKVCMDRSLRLDGFATVLRDNIKQMMRYQCNTLQRLDVEGGLDAMAAAMRPDSDPWAVFMGAAERLLANHRGLHSPYGGTRDLIKG